MAIQQPVYSPPGAAVAGSPTHIQDHNSIRTALIELQTYYILPSGGLTGQVLAKASNTTGDYEWVTVTATGGGGGTTDHSQLTNISRGLPDQHPISAIAGLDFALGGKAPLSHTHSTSQITGTLPVAQLPARVEFVADKEKNLGSYPQRATVVGTRTTPNEVTVVWVGDTDPALAGVGVINGDRWIKTV